VYLKFGTGNHLEKRPLAFFRRYLVALLCHSLTWTGLQYFFSAYNEDRNILSQDTWLQHTLKAKFKGL